MRQPGWMLAGILALSFNAAMAADGDGAPASGTQAAWARWQGRVSLGVASSPWRLGADQPVSHLSSASFMGDYYFSDSLGGPSLLGGFRATSGLIFGPRGLASTGLPGLATGSAFSVGSHAFQAAAPNMIDPTADSATQPYLGLGYTGLSAASGWSFSADMGLLARTGYSTWGRTQPTSQSLDDAIRQMRMTPLLQLGVSYTF